MLFDLCNPLWVYSGPYESKYAIPECSGSEDFEIMESNYTGLTSTCRGISFVARVSTNVARSVRGLIASNAFDTIIKVITPPSFLTH